MLDIILAKTVAINILCGKFNTLLNNANSKNQNKIFFVKILILVKINLQSGKKYI